MEVPKTFVIGIIGLGLLSNNWNLNLQNMNLITKNDLLTHVTDENKTY